MFDQCAPAKIIKTVTFEPLGKVVSGVTYTESGQTYPIFETGVPGIGYVLGGRTASASPTPPPLRHGFRLVLAQRRYIPGLRIR